MQATFIHCGSQAADKLYAGLQILWDLGRSADHSHVHMRVGKHVTTLTLPHHGRRWRYRGSCALAHVEPPH